MITIRNICLGFFNGEQLIISERQLSLLGGAQLRFALPSNNVFSAGSLF